MVSGSDVVDLEHCRLGQCIVGESCHHHRAFPSIRRAFYPFVLPVEACAYTDPHIPLGIAGAIDLEGPLAVLRQVRNAYRRCGFA